MIILAVDFGDARTGLACCDRSELLASPAGVISETDFEVCIQKKPQRLPGSIVRSRSWWGIRRT